ncbi:MAG: hypothetical protein B2I17_06430 [Thermoplasmatales archaeon B_DKE]|nr:MAG: hypothetical protein B2I17_06430 [Thermoplasmatales archaeon B_DKE]
MVSKKQIIAIVIAISLFSLGGYTLASAVTEPHLPNPNLTSVNFAKEVIANQPIPGRLGYSLPFTLFFHNFSLDGNSARYGFSLSMDTFATTLFAFTQIDMATLMTKVNQSIGFPYFGTFLLEVYTSNITINVNGTVLNNYYQSIAINSQWQNYLTYSVKELTYNDSINWYFFGFYTGNVSATINKTMLQTYPAIHWIYGNSYNVTYSLEVAPVIEYGPYSITGPVQWISHTFQVSNGTGINGVVSG